MRKVLKSIDRSTLLFSRDRFLFSLFSVLFVSFLYFFRLYLHVGTYLTDWLVGWLVTRR